MVSWQVLTNEKIYRQKLKLRSWLREFSKLPQILVLKPWDVIFSRTLKVWLGFLASASVAVGWSLSPMSYAWWFLNPLWNSTLLTPRNRISTHWAVGHSWTSSPCVPPQFANRCGGSITSVLTGHKPLMTSVTLQSVQVTLSWGCHGPESRKNTSKTPNDTWRATVKVKSAIWFVQCWNLDLQSHWFDEALFPYWQSHRKWLETIF